MYFFTSRHESWNTNRFVSQLVIGFTNKNLDFCMFLLLFRMKANDIWPARIRRARRDISYLEIDKWHKILLILFSPDGFPFVTKFYWIILIPTNHNMTKVIPIILCILFQFLWALIENHIYYALIAPWCLCQFKSLNISTRQ